jgi:hypothetical protein
MRSYEATSSVDASPDAVWAVLSDGAGWATWDSGVRAVEGAMSLGGTIKIQADAAPGRTFPVKVTAFDPPHRLCVTGGMPLGLFRGVRTYTVSPAADGTTTFHMREEYTGPLAGLIGRTIPDLQPSFDTFAQGLKRRVEAGG